MTLLPLLAQQPDAGPRGNPTFPLLIIGVGELFLFRVMMPAQRRQKKAEAEMRAGLKRGTKVLTHAGIIGTIVTIKDGDDEVVIRSEDARLRINRAAIARVLGTDEAESSK
jgi:preprotein translocase YajC subunit